jgi:hypothetical protein
MASVVSHTALGNQRAEQPSNTRRPAHEVPLGYALYWEICGALIGSLYTLYVAPHQNRSSGGS